MIVQPPCEQKHREKVNALDVAVDALVAKLIKAGDVAKNPAAKKAVQKEWDKLWAARTWIVESVREYNDVRDGALRTGEEVHFG